MVRRKFASRIVRKDDSQAGLVSKIREAMNLDESEGRRWTWSYRLGTAQWHDRKVRAARVSPNSAGANVRPGTFTRPLEIS